jgi:diadenosine tetraphosphate (Ap4A) HIT family hydrolase
MESHECLVCKSNSGEKRISPGCTIFDGEYWNVEHAYPVKVKGWLVIVLKRHAEALHEITQNEFLELAKIQSKITCLLYAELNCEKEYISCYAEAEHFYHIHFHIFAKPHDLPVELRGRKSFALLNPIETEIISKNEIIIFCAQLRKQFEQTL